MTISAKNKHFIKIALAFLISPWISGAIYYLGSWSAPFFEGKIQSHQSYLNTYEIYPLEQITSFSILHYYPFILLGLPIFLICNKLKTNSLKTYLLIWAIVGIALGLSFSGLFWTPDEKESFRHTYWVLYSLPISIIFGGAAFWLIGIRPRNIGN